LGIDQARIFASLTLDRCSTDPKVPNFRGGILGFGGCFLPFGGEFGGALVDFLVLVEAAEGF
jgi:hypothetical protein